MTSQAQSVSQDVSMSQRVETLGGYIRRVREARGMTATRLARCCGLSRQYLSDLEHDRRGQVLEARTAARLAAALDVPSSEIATLVDDLTSSEQEAFATYHRVLRSNARALMVLTLLQALRKHVTSLKEASKRGEVRAQLVEALETTVESLDDTLQYTSRQVGRRLGEGAGGMSTPKRRA